jgi:hypothetical protein
VDQLARRRGSATTGLLLLVAGLAACTSDSAGTTTPRPTASVRSTAGVLPVSPSPSTTPSLTIPDLPPPEPGLTTLASLGLRTGGAELPEFSGKPGDVQITILCTGGNLVLHLDPVTVTTIPCAVGSITPSRNVFHLTSPRKLGIRVEVAGGVEWNLRVEE